MFEYFTEGARRVVVYAQEEARLLKHNYIGTEHLLLALVREGDGIATQALRGLGVDLADVREQVVSIIGRGQKRVKDHIPFTPRAKKVLELSLRESRQLGHADIGPEHILLGLIREGEGVAAQVLQRLGADLPRVREQVMRSLAGGVGEVSETLTTHEPQPVGPRCPSCHVSVESLDTTAVTARDTGDEAADERALLLVQCPMCGVVLGVLSE